MGRPAFELTPEARGDAAGIPLPIAEDSPRIAERVRVQLLEELLRMAAIRAWGTTGKTC